MKMKEQTNKQIELILYKGGKKVLLSKQSLKISTNIKGFFVNTLNKYVEHIHKYYDGYFMWWHELKNHMTCQWWLLGDITVTFRTYVGESQKRINHRKINIYLLERQPHFPLSTIQCFNVDNRHIHIKDMHEDLQNNHIVKFCYNCSINLHWTLKKSILFVF